MKIDTVQHFGEEYSVREIKSHPGPVPVFEKPGFYYLVGSKTQFASQYETSLLTSYDEVLPQGDTLMHVKEVTVGGESVPVEEVDGEYVVEGVASVKKQGSHPFGYFIQLSRDRSSTTNYKSVIVEA